ncbi:MAG: cupin [Myxococcota bacterium]|jgi:hypothetical protein|nr:cupin [Myxococcota bacterium]
MEEPLHLGLGATAEIQPQFTGDMAWYEAYAARTESDGKEGRLVAMHRFTASWDTWEVHPEGAEVVLCVAGEMTLIQEIDGKERRIILQSGEYAVNQPGVWHTADIAVPATGVFITAGAGTEVRPR